MQSFPIGHRDTHTHTQPEKILKIAFGYQNSCVCVCVCIDECKVTFNLYALAKVYTQKKKFLLNEN